ncbi:hypothetical protein JCM10296v2_001283 [Rhodotorula toruloides]
MPATRRKTRRIKREEDDEAPYQPRGARKKAGSSNKKERPKRRQPCDHCKSTRHRCIISSVPMEHEDVSDDDDRDQHKLPCDACIASGRSCTYGVLEVDWQGRKRAYGVVSELDERLAKLEVLLLRKTGATSAYELDDLDSLLAKIGLPQDVDEEPPSRDADDGVRRRPAKPLGPPLPLQPLPPLPPPAVVLKVDNQPTAHHKITFAQDLFEVASSFWPANPLASGLTWHEPFLQLDGAAEELASALSTLYIGHLHKTSQPVARNPSRTLSKLWTPATFAPSLLLPTPRSAYPTTHHQLNVPTPRHAWTPVASKSPLTPPLTVYKHSLPTPIASPITPVKTVSITTLVHPHQISPPPESCLWRYFSDSAPVLPVSPPPSLRSARSRTTTSSSAAA